jgi:RNA polymerase sigma-70 factor (ECF subfamily)
MIHNEQTADDIAQDVFVKAYFSLPKFKFESEFGTWLYRITVNKAKDYMRKEKKFRNAVYKEIKNYSINEMGELKEKEAEEEKERRKILLHKLIQTLPEKYQTIISLRDIQGCSYEKITKILKISLGTVNSRLHRARKLLRKKTTPLLFKKGNDYEM